MLVVCRSKQHQKAVEDLRAELEEEEVAVDGNGLQAGAGQSDGQVQAANDDTIDDEEDIGSSAPGELLKRCSMTFKILCACAVAMAHTNL